MGNQPSQSGGWQVEESASAAYERYLVPPMFAPWADQLVESVDLDRGDRILDVACGTGIVARRAASRVGTSGSVVGLDINDRMLEVAAKSAAKDDLAIEWRKGDATELPFADEAFDVIYCQQALQFFDDPAIALEEMHRVLAPGGQLALSVWRPIAYQPAYVVLADALAQYVGDEAGTMMRSPFPAWDGDDLRALVDTAGFDNRSVTIEIGSVRYPSVDEFVRREAASSPLAEPIAAIERAVREELIRTVAAELAAYRDDNGIVSPMESYVVNAGKNA